MNNSKNKKIHIVLLFGGRSAEHEVSIQSARNIARALNKDRYELLPIYISRKGIWYHVDRVSAVPDGGKQVPAKGYREVFLKPGEETAQIVDSGDYRGITESSAKRMLFFLFCTGPLVKTEQFRDCSSSTTSPL
jgi:D-alanine-D-alanine ligase-like ATP-grasp enzyme